MRHLALVALTDIYPLNGCSVGRITNHLWHRDITVVVQIISGRKQLQHGYFIRTHTAYGLNKVQAAQQDLHNSINVREVNDYSMLVRYVNLIVST